MKVDFSKAPAWAIGHALHAFGGEIREVWVGEHQYQRLDQLKAFPYGGGNSDHRHNPRRSEFHFEQLRPEPWTGEGLPPVGTVCDLKFDHWTDWERHEILCHGKSFMFVRELNSGLDREGSMSMDGIMFRQVRTPEQIAEEARIAELNQMVGVIKDYPGGRHGVDHLAQLKIQEEACIDLYDAGWRKQVSK